MTTNELPTDPTELAKLLEAINEDPDVQRTWALYQEARQAAASGLAAGGAGTARVAVEQTKAACDAARRTAINRLLES